MIIRQIMACERDRVKEFYFAFSAEDRRKRFSYTLADATVSKYVDSFDFARYTILGAFSAHAELIGLAELAPGTTESELAFSVRPDMRCRRIGTRLMERILLHARMTGIGKVFVLFPSENTPMRNLARSAAMQETAEGSDTYASRDLPAPTAEELSHWPMQDSVAHASTSAFWQSSVGELLLANPNQQRPNSAILATLPLPNHVIT